MVGWLPCLERFIRAAGQRRAWNRDPGPLGLFGAREKEGGGPRQLSGLEFLGQQLGGRRTGRWGRVMGSLGHASLRKLAGPGGVWSWEWSLDTQAGGMAPDMG